MPRVLLTSICRPIGPAHGDAPSVGYELLHRQVTRAQGIFSPRALHLHFSLEYIAENLDSPAVVLQYPSKRELIRELKKGYEYVGVSFLLAVFHRMKDVVALVRKYSPGSKIVLGGYGTVLNDEILKPFGDHICREEGVAFFRELLGEPPKAMPYKHPMIVSRLKVLSNHVSNTGMIFAGLGCPNGCDFCCTSHFFSRKHVKLLPTGKDIYDVVERYLDIDPGMAFTVLDEDFLLNRRRAMEFRECVQAGGRSLSMFVFSSVKAISQYTVREIQEMGITGFWIGYEGTRSNFAKQQGRPVGDIFREFKDHGITILTSMIVGFDYQNQEVVAQELDGLMELKPALAQFLIYGPTPGTPFYDRIMKENLLQDHLIKDPDLYYRKCDGFSTMIKHPTLSTTEIENIQRWCFAEDYRRLGPSIFRVVETALLGYLKHKDSPEPWFRTMAARYAREVRVAYPVFLAGRLFGPGRTARRWIRALERRAHAGIGAPTWRERAMALFGVAASVWTWVTLRFDAFQHPSLTRHAYRMPETERGLSHLWDRLHGSHAGGAVDIRVELQHARRQVWLRLAGLLETDHAAALGARLRDSLARTKSRLVLDLKDFRWKEDAALRALAETVGAYRSRIRVVLPRLSHAHPGLLLLTSLFKPYVER